MKKTAPKNKGPKNQKNKKPVKAKPVSEPKKSLKTNPTIKKFALASFLNDLGSDMIYPIWPIFVTSTLGANMTILGLIDGVGEAVVSVAQAVSGFLADRLRKRKIFIWLGYTFGSFSRVGYALTTAWPQLLVFRVFDRAGKIRSSPRDAMIADLSTGANRGHNFGILRAMDNLGAVFGILVCIFLFDRLGYQKLFLLAALPSLVGVAIIIFLVKESPKYMSSAFRGFSLKDFNKDLTLLFVLSSVFSLGYFSYSFLMITAQDFGFKAGFIPVLYLIFNAMASVVSIPFGRLSDIAGRKTVMMISFSMWLLLCLLVIYIRSPYSIFAIFALYGIQKGAMDPVQKTFVSELAPAQSRASALGAFQMFTGLTAIPASLIAGLLWDRVNPLAPFYFSVTLCAIAMALLVLVKERKKRGR